VRADAADYLDDAALDPTHFTLSTATPTLRLGYILLEFAELGNLYNRIEAGRIPEREAAILFRQIVCAVAHLHSRGIIHRDIKPENVFLARTGSMQTVKLGDFGWAIVKRATSKRTTICGTMEYLPPEVCRGARESIALNGGGIVAGASISEEYDESFDLYTLGVLLYEMLVGHVRRRAAAARARQRHHAPPTPSSPPALRTPPHSRSLHLRGRGGRHRRASPRPRPSCCPEF
jgi:serine/threonine protein kinase